MNRLIILFLIFSTFLSTTYSQSPYEVNWKKEVPYIGVGAITSGAGAYLSKFPSFLTKEELLTLNPGNINNFDRLAIGNSSETAELTSEMFWIGSHIAPFIIMEARRTRSNYKEIFVLYGEAAAINLGLTLLSKSIFQRPRPFVYDANVSDDLKLTQNAKTSFFSEHTSMTAVNTFFVAKVYSDYYRDSKWKPFVWGAAATIPAFTGYLRVASGQDYPTDVIAGYIVGAAVGILVPHLHHHEKPKNRALRFDLGYNSVRVTWKLDNVSK